MTDPKRTYSLPLAQGELSEQDALELQLLKEQIRRDVGFFCDGYKEHCLRRRIAVRMRARGMHSYAEYAGLLLRDADEYQKLHDAVTINVSKFFRNPEVWHALDTHVLPQLFASRREVRMWSAGCAGGEEPYTIAMLLREHAARNGGGNPARFDILGTDIDRQSLENAERGEYGAFAFTDIDPTVRHTWFDAPTYTCVKPEIRNAVRFETMDLITTDFDAGACHVIFCRNVVIYFERAIQEMLFEKFHDALAPGGFLVLGKVETLFGRAGAMFRPLAQRERIFVKR